MIRHEIINEKLKDHRNKANQSLLLRQIQRERGPTFYLMDHQVGQSTSSSLGQTLATATLSAVPTLTYEEMNSNIETYQGRLYQCFPNMGREKRWVAEPRDRDEVPFCYTYHHSYSPSTVGCRDIAKHPNNQRRNSHRQRDESYRQGWQLRNHVARLPNESCCSPKRSQRMLADNGSSINVIFWSIFDKMEVDHELIPMTSSLYGIIGNIIFPRENHSSNRDGDDTKHGSPFYGIVCYRILLYLPRSTQEADVKRNMVHPIHPPSVREFSNGARYRYSQEGSKMC